MSAHVSPSERNPAPSPRTIDSLESKAMCDLVYLNLLREKVRLLQAEDKRAAAVGAPPHERFVPYTMPARSQS